MKATGVVWDVLARTCWVRCRIVVMGSRKGSWIRVEMRREQVRLVGCVDYVHYRTCFLSLNILATDDVPSSLKI